MSPQLSFWFFRRTLPHWWVLAAVTLPILKLCSVLNGSWWWILLPAYAPIAVLFILPGSALFWVIIYSFYKSKTKF
ncbi:hypothetical protein [Spirosoma endophyticum]|uniref:Transmembrane protein n=1 Tax=Spirosoma endophyticum TaxID=662367 RepID=A0A1I1SKD2_9BACT|nr:hypothetical protein [Spirosoma endophyticum]SFD46916.1 hypothetical protein SAMN05216167_105140 [Spirosoma endophyticum]